MTPRHYLLSSEGVEPLAMTPTLRRLIAVQRAELEQLLTPEGLQWLDDAEREVTRRMLEGEDE